MEHYPPEDVGAHLVAIQTITQRADDFTNRDFDSWIIELRSRATTAFPGWTDFNVPNFGNMLLELFAHTLDVLSFTQDQQFRETRITFARLRRSMILLGRLVQPPSEQPDDSITAAPAVAEPQRKTSARRGRQADALFIKTTCRSGESIRYSGDVVVLADVNPGAEIVADGDVVVFGRLRGVAHAGARGDTKATIIAHQLAAARLQIGSYIGLPSTVDQRAKSTESGPQIAYVRRRSICVAPFAGRYARYGRGILYDG